MTLTFGWGDNHEIANLRINSTTAPKPIRAPGTSLPDKEIADILKLAPEKRTAPQKQKLANAYKQIALSIPRTCGSIANSSAIAFLLTTWRKPTNVSIVLSLEFHD